MRKISLFLAMSVSLLITSTGCLKDKGFENQEYGIQTKDIKGVAFPQAASSPVVVGITGQAAPLTIAGPLITLETPGAAESDVALKLEYNDAAVTDAGLTPLPAGSYTLSNLSPVIKKDSTYVNNLTLTINNSNTLDPTKTYGVGFKITSVDGGYQIARNSNTVVFGITIKNQYDGIYTLKGNHNRPTPNYTFPYETVIHMITQGPNSVRFYWPEVRDFGHPIGVGPNNSLSWYGNTIAPVVVFNQATNLVTDVFNNPPNATPIAISSHPTAGVGRFVPTATATQPKMYVYWMYNGNPERAFFDTLYYIGPRP